MNKTEKVREIGSGLHIWMVVPYFAIGKAGEEEEWGKATGSYYAPVDQGLQAL